MERDEAQELAGDRSKGSHIVTIEIEFYPKGNGSHCSRAECPGKMCTLEKPHQVNVENRGKRVRAAERKVC